MKISKRSEYGLRALLDMAACEDRRPVPIKELADRNNIPVKFLEQILLSLRNAGIVHSQAGPHGGYTLGRPARNITLGEVIRTLDGTIAPVSCVSQIAYEPCTCPDERTCPLRAAMNKVRDAIVAVVDCTSLIDAVASGRALAGQPDIQESHEECAGKETIARDPQSFDSPLGMGEPAD